MNSIIVKKVENNNFLQKLAVLWMAMVLCLGNGVGKAVPMGADISALIGISSAKITQNGKQYEVYPKTQGDAFDFQCQDPFGVSVAFDIPVNQGANSVRYGDYGEMLLATNLQVNPSVFSTPLPMLITTPSHPFFGKTLGTVTLESRKNASGENEIYAKIHFAGDKDFFQEGAYSVGGAFQYNFEFSGQSGLNDIVNQFTIFEEVFEVTFPAIETDHTVKKSATFQEADHTITWTSELSKHQGNVQYALDGLTFRDNLEGVGAYVEGSFMVDGMAATPSFDGTILAYTFPNNYGQGPKTVTFKTRVTGADTMKKKQYANTAELLKGETVLGTGSANIRPETQWINKYGILDEKTDKLFFYLEVNKNAYHFDTLYLHEKQLFPSVYIESASYQKGVWNSETASYEWAENTKQPLSFYDAENKIYKFENVDSPLKIEVIVAEDTTDTEDPNIVNNCGELSLDGNEILERAWASVRKLNNYTLTKNIGDRTEKGTHEITIDIHSENNDFEVYDMLLYSIVDQIDDIKDANGVTLQDDDINLLKVKYGQGKFGNKSCFIGNMIKPVQTHFGNRYYDQGELLVRAVSEDGTLGNSLTEGDQYIFSLHPIIREGKEVGELVRVHFKNAGNYRISFETMPTNPLVLAGNFDLKLRSEVYKLSNKAYVVRNENIRARDDAVLTQYVAMFEKNTLSNTVSDQTEFTEQDLLNVTYKRDGYNYQDNSILYRLSLNHHGQHTYETLGALEVVDTLPLGYTLKPFSKGEYFQMYRAQTTLDGKLKFTSIDPEKVDVQHVAVVHTPATFFDDARPKTQESISLTFNKNHDGGIFQLNAPYIILLKAEICDATLKEMTRKKESTAIINNAKLIIKDFRPKVDLDVEIDVEYQDVVAADMSSYNDFQFNVVTKKHDYKKDGNQVVVNWEIIYDTNKLDFHAEDVAIIDTLPEGIAIPLRADGQVDYSKMNLIQVESTDPSGKVYGEVTGGKVTLNQENVSYDAETRRLEVKIPDATKAYSLQYQTFITGNAGQDIRNKVALQGFTYDNIETSGGFQISSSSASASMKLGGSFEIKKVDYHMPNKGIGGVGFALYTTNDAGEKVKQFAKRTTDSNGKVRFVGLPTGTFLLEEYATSEGYARSTQMYVVNIDQKGNVSVRKTEGKNQGENLLKNKVLTVKNIKQDRLLIDIQATKKWENNEDGGNASVEISLYRGLSPTLMNELVQTVQITKENGWVYRFKDVPSVEETTWQEYHYTVKETPVAGFQSEVSGNKNIGFTIQNTPVVEVEEKVEISVKKTWENNDPKGNTAVNVTLYRGTSLETATEVVTTATILATEAWGYVFDALAHHDEMGNEYVYTVKEEAILGFESEVYGNQTEGFTIQNTLVFDPNEVIDIPVEKRWATHDPKNHREVQINLFRKTSMTAENQWIASAMIRSENGWRHVFKGLKLYDTQGNRYTYLLEEVPIEGFTSEMVVENGVVLFINTPTQSNPEITPTPMPASDVPQTGDEWPVFLLVSLSTTSAFTFVKVLKMGKHKNEPRA